MHRFDVKRKTIYNTRVMVRKKPTRTDAADAESEDMVFEMPPADEPDIAAIEENVAEKIKQYKDKLQICQKERQEYLDGWQRAKADYLNSKRRAETEREQDSVRYATRFITSLLPLCDSFDLAVQTLTQQTDTNSEWRIGIEQVYNQLQSVLKTYHVEVLEPVGVAFDPHFHEAVSETLVTNPDQHHIIQSVLQQGYGINDTLIRPAKVVVGRYDEKPANT